MDGITYGGHHLLLDLDAKVGAVVLANGDNAQPDVIAEALVAAMVEAGAIAAPASE